MRRYIYLLLAYGLFDISGGTTLETIAVEDISVDISELDKIIKNIFRAIL